MEIDRAIEVFVRGFSFTRGFTHPFLAERMGPLWVMRDGPRTGKKGAAATYRVEEWIAHQTTPAEVDRLARAHTRGRYAVCAFYRETRECAPLRDAYKTLGYRLRASEPMMLHTLNRIPRCAPPAGVTVERVRTQALADLLAKAARSRQILPEQLNQDAPLRQYAARAGTEIVGWVRSITVTLGDNASATWCSNMFVIEQHRRRGIARAMLSRMLADDRAAGAQAAVLLASHVGAKLYPLMGYDPIGTLLLFSPRKHNATGEA